LQKINKIYLRTLIKEMLDNSLDTHDIEILDLPTDRHYVGDHKNFTFKSKLNTLINTKNKKRKKLI